jgi:hypothetical protein
MNNTILILVLLFTLIIGASLFCGCCKYPIFVSLSNLLMTGSSGKEGIDDTIDNSVGGVGSNTSVVAATKDINKINNLQNLIPQAIVNAASSTPASRDGFISEGASSLGAPLNDKNNGDLASSWISKATTFASEFGYGDINNTGTAYTGTPVPLPDGELVIFAQNKFKPECCPSPYSTSTGCACITPEQINYLNTRGGNRTSDSGV